MPKGSVTLPAVDTGGSYKGSRVCSRQVEPNNEEFGVRYDLRIRQRVETYCEVCPQQAESWLLAFGVLLPDLEWNLGKQGWVLNLRDRFHLFFINHDIIYILLKSRNSWMCKTFIHSTCKQSLVSLCLDKLPSVGIEGTT